MFIAALRRLASLKCAHLLVAFAQLAYSFAALRACVRQTLVRASLAKFLKRVGIYDFVKANQAQPCALSHRGTTCTQNFANLGLLFGEIFSP